MPFSDEVKTKALLWCDRHCCLCKKACGPNIEVHHIVPESEGGPNDIDNAIPLCLDCHGTIGSYNIKHPIGNKYKIDELKSRREQIYEEFTRHLVPPVYYTITNLLGPEPDGKQKKRKFPDVGFQLHHCGDSLPVKVKTVMTPQSEEGRHVGSIGGHYSGEKLWHLNPRMIMSGHFKLPEKVTQSTNRPYLKVLVTIIDQYDREHDYLPIGWIYEANSDDWFLEP